MRPFHFSISFLSSVNHGMQYFMNERLKHYLFAYDITIDWRFAILFFILAVAAFICTRKGLRKLALRIDKNLQTPLLPVLTRRKVIQGFSFIAPGLVLYHWARAFTGMHDKLLDGILALFIHIIVLLTLDRAFMCAQELYEQHPMAKHRPIKGYIQVGRVIIYCVGALVFIALIWGKSPWKVVSGLGAMTAVIMLIFRNTLLSMVAGLHIALNDTFRIGDRLTLPDQGADGTVTNISLHAVKVLNADKTISTIPMYTFLEKPAKTWRYIEEHQARRITSEVHVDPASLRFLDEGELHTLAGRLGEEYFADTLANGAPVLNISAYMLYLDNWLRRREDMHTEYPLCVRFVQKNPYLLSVGLYVFTTHYTFVNYENAMRDVTLHAIDVLPLFFLDPATCGYVLKEGNQGEGGACVAKEGKREKK